ncbi:MAG: DUF2085 domain-containing protein [candidate division Zixibacteria bacterium]|nr:DUF2085 domain-containing protein [candidate division Zixibacteria bacterium]
MSWSRRRLPIPPTAKAERRLNGKQSKSLARAERVSENLAGLIVKSSSTIVTILVFLPLFGFLAEPVLRQWGYIYTAGLLRSAFSLNCHQIPSRCPSLWGIPAIICFRCLGFYIGVVAGWSSALILKPSAIKRAALFTLAAFAVNGIDALGIGLSLWDWNNWVRFGLGFAAGIGPGFILMAGVREASKRYLSKPGDV